MEDLIKKYNVPAPRYTSYPTVPYWDKEPPSSAQWLQIVQRTFKESNTEKGISLYIHLPFCENLCTYCGCNKRITKNHLVETPYIGSILNEWKLYLDTFESRPVIRELHLGGGTPTFFSPENLRYLIKEILKDAFVHPQHEFSFEGHPNNTSFEHLRTLYDCGFRRVSFGVQDFDIKVQKAINRVQTFEKVEEVTSIARKIGYFSVNYDLIYGLPFQNLESVRDTIEKTGILMPDRIAFYSYAHVPWTSPAQRSYTEADLPDNSEKRALYELGRGMLKELGYIDIGMDHFSLPSDSLYVAMQRKSVHRNFMGYTVCNTDLLIGLGASSISDAKYAYFQNTKKVEDYQREVNLNKFPISKGHILSHEDITIRRAILDLICKGELLWQKCLLTCMNEDARGELIRMQDEGLVQIDRIGMKITEKGSGFIRNICMALDKKHRLKKASEAQVFSKAI